MGKEFYIPHEKLNDPQTITQVNIEEYRKHGFEFGKDEADFEEDFKNKRRVIKIKSKPTIFDMGRRSRR